LAGDWSPEEVAATVEDYFAMLENELRRASYNERDHNRRLQQRLSGRSAGAIEFKHANISAIMNILAARSPLLHRAAVSRG
jgi:hypothetical protein